jgi:putative ABC transport system permease protein
MLGITKGDTLRMDGRDFMVSGIFETGGDEDNLIFMDLQSLQELKNMHGKVSRVMVSALTKPMDSFAYKDPESMSQVEYEKWYCTGYVTTIASQLEEVFEGSTVKPVWKVADTEGRVLGRLNLLIYLLSFIVLIAATLGVSATMIMSLLRRVQEIGLMKAVGADSRMILTVFLSEGVMVGLIGGLFGYLFSAALTGYIGVMVFNAAFEQGAMLFPLAIGSAVIISVAGTVIPVRKALRIKPGVVLKGAE